jgi:hypothetical protein
VTDTSTVALRVVVEHAPSDLGTEFGIQDTPGRIVAGVADRQGRIAFECEVRVAPRGVTGDPNFLGPLTHGSPASRHLYLSQKKSGADGWIKRIKVPLAPITWDLVRAAEDGALETTVDGRSTATVAVTWRVAPRTRIVRSRTG